MYIELFVLVPYYPFSVCMLCSVIPSCIHDIGNSYFLSFFFVSFSRSLSDLLILSKNQLWFHWFALLFFLLSILLIFALYYFFPSACFGFILLFLFSGWWLRLLIWDLYYLMLYTFNAVKSPLSTILAALPKFLYLIFSFLFSAKHF